MGTRLVIFAALLQLLSLSGLAQQPYPYPTRYIDLHIAEKNVRMAYMDVSPLRPTVLQ